MCTSYILFFLTSVSFFKYLMAVLALIVFIICIPKSKPLPKYFSMLILVISISILVRKGEGIEGVLLAISTNVPLLTLLILVPLISIPIKSGSYIDSIYYYLGRMVKVPIKLFSSVSISVFLLGPILHLGSIRLINEILKDLQLKKDLLAKAYVTGFSTIALWSPFLGSVALTLYYLDISIANYIYFSLPLAFILLIVGNLLFLLNDKRSYRNQKGSNISTDGSRNSLHQNQGENEKHLFILFKLCFLIVLFIISVLLMEKITQWPMMFIISIVSIITPVIWSIVFRKRAELIEHVGIFKNQSVPNMNNEVVMFLSAGLFATALSGTSFAQSVNILLQQISSISFLVFAIATVLIVLVTTLIGVHPIVVITILVTQIDPAFIGARPESIALLLMLSWSISAVLSPTNPLNLIVSESVKQSSFTVGFRLNGFYVVMMFVVGLTYVYLIH